MNIYVTGIGCISGLGISIEEHLDAFREKRSGLGPVTRFSTCHNVPVSEVRLSDDELKEKLQIPFTETVSRTALLGMYSASEAWKDAGIEDINRWRTGIISSTSNGGMDLTEHYFYPAFHQNKARGRLRHIIHHDAGDSTEQIAKYLKTDGFRTTISTACSSAANAIMLGARLINQGYLDVAIVGGTDALCRFTLNGFGSLMILDKEPNRPFDDNRKGLNLGEGAGYIVLQAAHTLNKKPYCRLAGYANANDAYHQTASSPEGKGAYLAMKQALDSAGITSADVDYINAHGTATPNNDESESAAIIRLFGNQTPPFSSTKPFTGHTLGAAGGVEAVFSVLAIRHQIMFPNLHFGIPIPGKGLIPVIDYRENVPVRNVLSNSFGFGGNNTSLVFSAIDEKLPETIQHKTEKPDLSPAIYIRAVASNYEVEPEDGKPVFSLREEPLDKNLIPNASVRRRMSRILRMGITTGLNCLQMAGQMRPDAIITATAYGCLADTEKFLCNLHDNGEEMASPTSFIQSTFNTIGGQIALLTGNNCYNNTYVHRGISLESALIDACCLLSEGEAKSVLCGSIDEITPTLAAIRERMNQGKTGEGSAFFLLSTEKNPENYARILDIETFHGSFPEKEIGNRIKEWLREKNIQEAEIIYTDNHKELCGDFPTAVSFSIWKTVCRLKKENSGKKVLLYSSFGKDHSFILLTSPE